MNLLSKLSHQAFSLILTYKWSHLHPLKLCFHFICWYIYFQLKVVRGYCLSFLTGNFISSFQELPAFFFWPTKRFLMPVRWILSIMILTYMMLGRWSICAIYRSNRISLSYKPKEIASKSTFCSNNL